MRWGDAAGREARRRTSSPRDRQPLAQEVAEEPCEAPEKSRDAVDERSLGGGSGRRSRGRGWLRRTRRAQERLHAVQALAEVLHDQAVDTALA